MSNKINNFQIHTNSSIILFGLTISLLVVYLFFPIFAGNFYYDIGTILIYSGPLDKIPHGFALCDGTNNTPDLTNKFIIGAYTENDIQIVESINNDITNNDIPYIGPGLLVKNPLDNQPKNVNDSIIPRAFSRGNIPYMFGSEITSSINTKAESKKGTAYFKKYTYLEGGNKTCAAHDQSYYNTVLGTTEQPSTDTVDVCNNNKTILTDANLSDRQLKFYDESTTDPIQNDDFKYFVDSKTNMLNNNEQFTHPYNQTYNTNTQIGFIHEPVKRRLFRDFEDYTLYLNGQHSDYNILPMNKQYDFHNYDTNNDITELSIPRNGSKFNTDYLHDFSYSTPYSNNPSFFKLAYIIKIK
tara:strand:- start:56 stop:1120 length:1065 start_codon:yes stop_codon:yes gene_type:complete